MSSGARCGLVAAALLLASCTVGPDYRRPAAPVPDAYKEAGWKTAHPADAIDRGAWWSLYKDPVLDDLEKRIDITNQNLKAAEASFRIAEAVVAQARAAFFPTLGVSASADRSRGGGGRGGSFTSTTLPGTVAIGGTTNNGAASTVSRGGSSGAIGNFFQVAATASWTPDLWGRIRRTVEGDVATAQASAGDLASARLSAQGQLASDYLQLRVADELKRLLDAAVAAYTESLRITQNQYAAGIVSPSDVAQAETQLRTTQAQAIAVGVTRAQLEHAIAVLIGVPPAELTIVAATHVDEVPAVPAGLPSELLERRPDIAAQERRMAAANAQIGVAEAAFFPNVTLSGDYGVAATMLANLFSASSRIWSLGTNLSQTVFDAGARHAQVEQARAGLDQTVADYRETVLTAFQQVEDELAALRILAQQAEAQAAAVAAAREAERIIFNQYRAGTVPYTNVVVAQTAALGNAETELTIRQSRLVASVALIQALGGGWDAARLPSRDKIESDVPLDFNPLPPADALPGVK